MTAALLDPQAAERLVKLLGMCGSAHAGERANAAAQADKLVRSLGLRWRDIISIASPPGDWRAMARTCRANGHKLQPKEFSFVNNIAMAQFEPSEKQMAWLAGIFRKIQT